MKGPACLNTALFCLCERIYCFIRAFDEDVMTLHLQLIGCSKRSFIWLVHLSLCKTVRNLNCSNGATVDTRLYCLI